MNVSLIPEAEKFIASKVDSGRYHSASEVVREALRLLEDQDLTRSNRLAEFNQELSRRIRSLDQGRIVRANDIQERLRQRSLERRKSRA